MARLRGRAPRGKRLRAGVPHGHWKTTTFVAGLRVDGVAAPMVLDGPINRDAFQAYVDQVLAFFSGQPPCLVAMEACPGAHHWGREIAKLGHEVRLVLQTAAV